MRSTRYGKREKAYSISITSGSALMKNCENSSSIFFSSPSNDRSAQVILLRGVVTLTGPFGITLTCSVLRRGFGSWGKTIIRLPLRSLLIPPTISTALHGGILLWYKYICSGAMSALNMGKRCLVLRSIIFTKASKVDIRLMTTSKTFLVLVRDRLC